MKVRTGEMLAVIEGPDFYCAIVLWNDVVVEAAPKVHFMKRRRWTRKQVRDYCERKGWKVSIVHELECAP